MRDYLELQDRERGLDMSNDMKRAMLVASFLAIAIALPVMANAQPMDMKDMKPDIKTRGQVNRGAGTVTKIDRAKGAITIAHGPIQSLNWPAMTMRFGVKDKAMLEKVKPGAKVEFGFVQSGKDYLITELR